VTECTDHEHGIAGWKRMSVRTNWVMINQASMGLEKITLTEMASDEVKW